MPWLPELFSAPVLQRALDRRRRDEAVSMGFFDGLMAGEPEALVASFAGEPELHDPVRGRIKGIAAFRAFLDDMATWLEQRHVEVEDVRRVILDDRGFEEVVLHVDGAAGRVALPFALVADHPAGGRIDELRLYYSSGPLTGHHVDRPPLLQRDPELRQPDIVAQHQRALAAGDIEAVVATFESDGYVREPSGDQAVHAGRGDLRTFYAQGFSHGGGIPLEPCALVDNGRVCALEYNVLRSGEMDAPPQAGAAVYARGQSGRLAAVRIYGDASSGAGP